MLNPKELALGREQFEEFYSSVMKKDLVQYDYRHTDGELFSTVKPTLEKCHQARDMWLSKKFEKNNEAKEAKLV